MKWNDHVNRNGTSEFPEFSELPELREAPVIIVEKELSYTIVGAALEVHKELGYGFHESVYVRSLAVLLTHWGIRVLREVPVTVLFRGVDVGTHRLDLLVENRVVVEVKSMERVPQIFRKQVRNYLAATDKELGLLINFGPSVETHRILRPLRLSSKHLSSRSGNSSNSGHSDVPSPPVDI